jgi:selT/selW/selH-like putative selenoprotein
LAEALKNELGIDAELIKSSGGVFEVEADGKLIFSKKQEYRFPSHDEIIASLKNK